MRPETVVKGLTTWVKKLKRVKKLRMMLKSWWGKRAEDEELENH